MGRVPVVHHAERGLQVLGVLNAYAFEPAEDKLVLAVLHFGGLGVAQTRVPALEDLHEKGEFGVFHLRRGGKVVEFKARVLLGNEELSEFGGTQGRAIASDDSVERSGLHYYLFDLWKGCWEQRNQQIHPY